MKNGILAKLRGYLLITVACAFYALSYVWCFAPNGIAFGGLTGLCQIVNHFVPAIPVGVCTIVLNIPLFLLGWRLIGGHLLVSSLYAMAVGSVFIDLLTPLWDWAPMDPLLACIFGGLLLGLSLGVVFQQGATTGGTDLASRLLKLKFQWLPMGKIMLVVEFVVVAATAVAFRSLTTLLYGLISIYVATKSMDLVLYGMDTAKVAYIISDREDDICSAIVNKLDRGVTILHGEGAYTGKQKKVLMCAFKQKEIADIRATVKELDPDAFLIVCDAHEVLGDGFRSYKKDGL